MAHPLIDIRESTTAINAHDWASIQSMQLGCDEEEVIKELLQNGEIGQRMRGNRRYWVHYGPKSNLVDTPLGCISAISHHHHWVHFRMHYEFRMQDGECLEKNDIVIVTRCGRTLTDGSRWYFGSLVRNDEIIPNRWFPPGVLAPLRDDRCKGARDFKANLLCQYTPIYRHQKWSGRRQWW